MTANANAYTYAASYRGVTHLTRDGEYTLCDWRIGRRWTQRSDWAGYVCKACRQAAEVDPLVDPLVNPSQEPQP